MGKRLSLVRKVVFRQLCLHGFVKRELDGGKGNLMRTILGVSEAGCIGCVRYLPLLPK
jgi:hypothetical protein